MKKSTSIKAIAALSMLLSSTSISAQSTPAATNQMVISKVFYAGTTQKGSTKNYTGGEEYIELHNNTGKAVDIAGMYIALVESESSTGAYLAKDRTNNEVKLKQVFQIPEDKAVEVAPWGTVVLAACAIDHSSAAENGADLSKADFEFGGMANDNPDVPNLNLIYSFNANTKAVNLTNGGDASLLIVSKKNGDKYLKDYSEESLVFPNGKTSGSKYLPFNAYYSMDAVDILKTTLTDGIYAPNPDRKRISEGQDKGFVKADQKMNKDGYIAYRKTALNHNGDLYLFDTGDSREDFAISNTIAVKEYDKTESGVTEVKVTIPESGYLPFKAEKYFFTEKGLYTCYVNISGGAVKFISQPGDSVIASNSAYVLVGAPGEHTVKYTTANRTVATAGIDYWIEDGNEYYSNGEFIYTGTTKYYPMKFVNEKGNARFVRDLVGDNPKSMKIDIEKEGRFYIKLNYFNEEETVIKWGGITPEEVATGISTVTSKPASDAVFTLQGVRVSADKLSRGAYIKNGKKFLVK